MNKAAPWNINGVGFDARDAARDAARRQGKSLGEWLHGVIADHAAEMGVSDHDVAGQERIDAVTKKLERMSARSADFDRRGKADDALDGRFDREAPHERRAARFRQRPAADERFQARRGFRDQDQRNQEQDFETSRQARSQGMDETDYLLEDAIASMERRSARAERRTDSAFASLAEMLEANEERRERERDAVSELSRKLSTIETKLGGADENPIKGALARLEARLDTIGRRGAAETEAHQNTFGVVTGDGEEPLRRLEDKLNSILDAVAGRPAGQASPVAISAARGPAPLPYRRLGDAIGDIAKRQRILDNGDVPSSPPRSERSADTQADNGLEARDPVVLAIQRDIASLNSKIDEMRTDVTRRRDDKSNAAVTGLRSEIATISASLDDLPQRGTVTALDDAIRNLTKKLEAPRFERADHFVEPTNHAEANRDADTIERRLEALTAKIDDAANNATAANHAAERARQKLESAQDELAARVMARLPETSDVRSLETLVRDLGQKIEAVQGNGAGDGALDTLQKQIAVLSERFGRSESGLASIGTLEHSMQALFAHLDETRASVDANAARTAREAVRLAMDEGRPSDARETAERLASLHAMQDDADLRTRSTLSAVHETLEKVVGRLASMEGDIAEVRKRRDPNEAGDAKGLAAPSRTKPHAMDLAAPARRPAVGGAPLSMSVGAAQPMLDPQHGERSGKRPISKALDADGEANRTDFISAARRAAKAAQTDPSVVALRSSGSDNAARAGLLLKSRDYVSSHKKPVLLGFAALFVILGTMAIVQRMVGQPGAMMADRTAPAPMARSYASAGPVGSAEQPRRSAYDDARNTDVLSPRASVGTAPLSNPIPGSDPIQTGSIPALPSFAARSAMAPIARTGLPSALRTLADAGDGPAEYELGVRYAEGKSVSRDFKLAAQWYGKAADQGLAPAQYRLASLYEKGIGVAQDKAKAKVLYTKAADAGNPRAMHNLAVMLADGEGTPDYEGAATWFRKAAQYGVHDSEYNLAILLARGLGVPQSLVQSYQWFTIAADQGDADAARKRDEIGTKLNANDLAVAKALATAFRPRTATVAATDVQPPPGGWDGASTSSPINSANAKLSSL